MPRDPVESFRCMINNRAFIYIEAFTDPEEFEIDDLVTIDNALTGIIQFVSSAMIGVRLIGTSVQRGDTDGSNSTGKRYFSCPQNDGMLVSPRRVVKRQLTKPDKARFKDALAIEGILLPTKPLELPEKDAEPVLVKESRGKPQMLAKESRGNAQSYAELPSAEQSDSEESYDEDLWIPEDYGNKQDSYDEDLLVPDNYKGKGDKKSKARKPAPVVPEEKEPSAPSSDMYMANIREVRDPAPVSKAEHIIEEERKQPESVEITKSNKWSDIGTERETEPNKWSAIGTERETEPNRWSTIGTERETNHDSEEKVSYPDQDTSVEEKEQPANFEEGNFNVEGEKDEMVNSEEELFKSEKEQSTTEARESVPFEVEAKTFAVQEQNKVLEERCEELKRALAAAQQERLEANKESKKSADVPDEQSKSNELQEENSDLKEEVTHLKQSLYHTNEKLRASEHREESLLTRTQMETEALKQMEGSSALEKELSEAKARNGKLQIRIQQLEDKCQSIEYLEEQNEELKKAISTKDKAFKKELGHFEELLHASQTVQHQMREHYERMEEENIQLEDRLIDLQKQTTELTNQKEAYYNAIDSKDRFEQVLKTTQEHCVILEKRTLNFEKEKEEYEAHMQERLSCCENEKNEMKEQLEDTEKKCLATLKKMEEKNKFTLYRADNLERELQNST